MEAAEEPASEWKDDGTLPLDGQEQLPFFCIDAHEEHANPGVVYLFGKVKLFTAWHVHMPLHCDGADVHNIDSCCNISMCLHCDL